jgi:hypothetical protein
MHNHAFPRTRFLSSHLGGGGPIARREDSDSLTCSGYRMHYDVTGRGIDLSLDAGERDRRELTIVGEQHITRFTCPNR